MHNERLPKTVKRWLDKNADKVAEYWTETDCFGEEHEGPVSIWCYLKRPYVNVLCETSIIHEATAKNFLEMASSVQPDEDWWVLQYGP